MQCSLSTTEGYRLRNRLHTHSRSDAPGGGSAAWYCAGGTVTTKHEAIVIDIDKPINLLVYEALRADPNGPIWLHEDVQRHACM